MEPPWCHVMPRWLNRYLRSLVSSLCRARLMDVWFLWTLFGSCRHATLLQLTQRPIATSREKKGPLSSRPRGSPEWHMAEADG